MNKFATLAAIAACAAAVSANAAVPTWLYGTKAPDSTADKVVTLSPNMSNVNVKWGKTVEFRDHGQSFAYTFDGPNTDPSVNLQRLAPEGMIGHPVTAYIRDFPETH